MSGSASDTSITCGSLGCGLQAPASPTAGCTHGSNASALLAAKGCGSPPQRFAAASRVDIKQLVAKLAGLCLARHLRRPRAHLLLSIDHAPIRGDGADGLRRHAAVLLKDGDDRDIPRGQRGAGKPPLLRGRLGRRGGAERGEARLPRGNALGRRRVRGRRRRPLGARQVRLQRREPRPGRPSGSRSGWGTRCRSGCRSAANDRHVGELARRSKLKWVEAPPKTPGL